MPVQETGGEKGGRKRHEKYNQAHFTFVSLSLLVPFPTAVLIYPFHLRALPFLSVIVQLDSCPEEMALDNV